LAALLAAFRAAPEAAGIGGPAVAAAGCGLFERCVWLAMASRFGQAAMAQRFRSQGAARRASEHELIACNLAISRRAWLAMPRGFDARLYPNEENELIRRFQAAGAVFRFDPALVVERRFAAGPAALATRFFRYGLSRMAHWRIRPASVDPVPLVPVAWVAYLLGLSVAASRLPASAWAFSPLAVYGLGAAVSAVRAARQAPRAKMLHAALILFCFSVMHLAYGVGEWVGMIAPSSDSGGVTSLRRWP
jgi:hypothetical protein